VGERILFLSDAAVRELLDMQGARAACEQVFRAMADGKVSWGDPPMTNLPQGGIRYYVKTCSVDTIPAAGFRIVGYAPNADGRISGTDTRHIILVDPTSTRKLMIMDEHWSYALRTAASAGIAIRALARPSARVAAVLGAGWIARACVWMLREVLPALAEIRVTSRRADTREGFARETSAQFGVRIVPVAEVEEAVRGAEVVITATTAEAPIVRPAWFAPGSIIYALGAGKEVDDDVYQACDKIVVEDWPHCMLIPEFRTLVSAGSFSRSRLHAELAEIVAGRAAGRESPDERIFVRSQGLAVQDIAIAHHVYRQACERGVGLWLDS